MNIRKTLIACLALAMAIVFSPLSELQAAPFVNAGSQPVTENLAQSVKMKRRVKSGKMMGKMKRQRMGKRRMGRMARSRAGRCGMNMYWKKGKCMDARNK